jgi:uncharacterized protein YegP (UPF0339 family)
MTYYLLRDSDGRWRWRLETDDGRLFAVAGETYPTEEDCRAAIRLMLHDHNVVVTVQERIS